MDELSRLSDAVFNDHMEVVDRLLPQSSPSQVYNALLMAISLGYDHISTKIITSPQYPDALRYGGTTDNLEDATQDSNADNTLFTRDVTPLILASQKNQFPIVELLISMGESIPEPHSNHCTCDKCRGSPNYDELRFSHKRLNTFKALCSEAYIVYTSTDPILTAFHRTKQLRALKAKEINFRAQYSKIIEELEEFTCDILTCIRDGHEQETILKKGTKKGLSRDRLARIKLAVHFKHRQFVANSYCQEKMAEMWYGKFRFIESANMIVFILFSLFCIIIYPFAVLAYLVWPCCAQVTNFVTNPFIKFTASIGSYLVFVGMIVAFARNELPSMGIRISQEPVMGPLWYNYTQQMTALNETPIVAKDIFLRDVSIDTASILVTIWIVGMAWQMICNISYERLYIFQNPYNIMEIPAILLYLASFALRYADIIWTRENIGYFQHESSWLLLADNDPDAVFRSYWLDADRHTWKADDVFYISEAMFCIANVLTICRMTYILAFSPHTGPLIVTLGKMMVDVFWFIFLLVLIIFAFVIGLHNILWYYPNSVRSQAETGDDYPAAFSQDPEFGSFSSLLSTLFWAIFGIADSSTFNMEGYSTALIETIAYILFACYEWIMIIILINILIAMMSESYEMISDEEDMHWKFYLSLLRLEFLRDDGSMCIPLNLIPTPRAFYDCFTRFRAGDCCRGDDAIKNEAAEEDEEEQSEEFEDVLPGKPLRPHFTVRPANIHKPVMVFIKQDQRDVDAAAIPNGASFTNNGYLDNEQQAANGDARRQRTPKLPSRAQLQFETVMQKVIARFVQRRTRVDDDDNSASDDKKKKNAEVMKALNTIERSVDKVRKDVSGLRTEFVTYVQSEIHSDDRRNVIHTLTGVDESAVTAATHLMVLKKAVDDQMIALADASKQQSERLAESLVRISEMQSSLMERLAQVELTSVVLERTMSNLPIKHLVVETDTTSSIPRPTSPSPPVPSGWPRPAPSPPPPPVWPVFPSPPPPQFYIPRPHLLPTSPPSPQPYSPPHYQRHVSVVSHDGVFLESYEPGSRASSQH